MCNSLQVAKSKLQQDGDRAKFYVDHKRSPGSLEKGEKVFLQVPLSSMSLSIGKCPKLLSRFGFVDLG